MKTKSSGFSGLEFRLDAAAKKREKVGVFSERTWPRGEARGREVRAQGRQVMDRDQSIRKAVSKQLETD